ncbi:MAG: hypothetical protein ACKO2O_00965 [Crocinitomicaceae bacterium]
MKLLYFFVLLVVCSCSFLDKERKEYFNQLDQLASEINALESKLLSNEIDTLAALQLATNSVELRIKNYLVLDTINMPLAKKLNEYKVMRRALGPLGAQFQKGKKSLREERETLKKLRTDIENGSGEREKYGDYISFERDKVKKISILIDDYVKQKNKNMNTFLTLHPELNEFSLSLLTKK